MNNQIKIALLQYRGNSSNSYTGRKEGAQARAEISLDTKDQDDLIYQFIVPNNTTALNPSFFLGMFYKSIKKLGIKKFEYKYSLVLNESDPKAKEQLEIDISEGKRHALNQMKSGGGLRHFIQNFK